MAYEKQIWNQYDALKTEEENIENGAVVTDNRMNHIEEGIDQTNTSLQGHIVDKTNPHSVTAEQVGLGNVPNYAAATEEEALAGESNDTVMTPSLTKAAAKSHVTKEDVGLSDVTNDEQATKTEFNAHTANKSNPHAVTASQVGAYSKTEADSKLALKANESEVIHNTGDETIAGTKTFTSPILGSAAVDVTTVTTGLGANFSSGTINIIKFMNLCIIQITNLTPSKDNLGVGDLAVFSSSSIPFPKREARGIAGLHNGAVNSGIFHLVTAGNNQQIALNTVASSSTSDSWSGTIIYDF